MAKKKTGATQREKALRFSPVSPPKEGRTTRSQMERKNLEKLPQELLVAIFCKVNHSDLKQLLLVSKTISKAASIAEPIHPTYSTPTKSLKGLNNSENYKETPGAPFLDRKEKPVSSFLRLVAGLN